jgi:host factor-I protein
MDQALDHAQKSKLPVTVIMTNGYQMHGVITAFDSQTVVIPGNGIDPEQKQRFVYRHAISTVILPEEIKVEGGDEA